MGAAEGMLAHNNVWNGDLLLEWGEWNGIKHMYVPTTSPETNNSHSPSTTNTVLICLVIMSWFGLQNAHPWTVGGWDCGWCRLF